MSWFRQSDFDVRLEWGYPAVEHLADEADCVIIVDVMSFSTCVSLAVDNGARIYPYPWKDESARIFAESVGAVTASQTRRFDGSGYSLSPFSLQNITRGERLVLPSPNGSALSFSARDKGIAVYSACFRNLSATAAACKAFTRILIIPCGERWPDGSLRPAVEDYVAAGGIVDALARNKSSPEAQAAASAYRYHAEHQLLHLQACSSAAELRQRGFGQDVDLCLALNQGKNACRLWGEYYAVEA